MKKTTQALLLFTVIWLVTLVAIWTLKKEFPNITGGSALDLFLTILQAVNGASLSFVLLQSFWTYAQKNTLHNAVTRALEFPGTVTSQTFRALSSEFRNKLLKMEIESIFIESDSDSAAERSKAVYNWALKPFIDGPYEFRENLSYRVIIKDLPAEFKYSSEITDYLSSSTDEYLWIEVQARYSQTDHDSDVTSVVFTFNSSDVNMLMRDKSIFYRELLQVDEHLEQLICSMNEDQRKRPTDTPYQS